MEEIKQEEKKKKINFFKKIWYSITKFEKYPEMVNEGVGRATRYLLLIIFIFALIIAILGVVQTNKNLNEGIQYIQENIPDITYINGKIESSNEEVQRITDETFDLGNIIIDVNTEDETIIEQYKNEISESEKGEGLIILKDKAIQISVDSENNQNSLEITYDMLVSNLFGDSKIELSKQDIIDFLNKEGRTYIIIINFFVYLIAYFIIYIISSFIYALLLSIIAYITGMIVKVKLRYSAAYSMSIYAFTLSNILNIIYFVVNYFTGITITCFQIAYIAIAYIYLVAVLFLIKTDFMKKQEEKKQEENINEEIKEDKQEEI